MLNIDKYIFMIQEIFYTLQLNFMKQHLVFLMYKLTLQGKSGYKMTYVKFES